jgi:5-methylcytosine-specific restriction protein A
VCAAAGRITPAQVCDHIVPHRGDRALFWNPRNHQALCAGCHNRKTGLKDTPHWPRAD